MELFKFIRNSKYTQRFYELPNKYWNKLITDFFYQHIINKVISSTSCGNKTILKNSL